MDPQQRLLLEVIYSSFHASGKPFSALSNLDASVCVGQCNNDWGHMGFSGSQESSDRSDLAPNRSKHRWKWMQTP